MGNPRAGCRRDEGGVWLLSAWLANNVPSWLLLLTLSVLIAGGAALDQMFVRRGFPGPKEDAHNDVMRFTLTAIAFLSIS